MSAAVWFGLLLTLVAGVLSGNCMLPMKFARRWAWENTWLIFSLVSLVLLPWSLGLVLAGDLRAIYAALPAGAFAAPLLFGAGWGIAQVLFGLSIARLGLALGYAIIIGLGAMGGTLVPLFEQHPDVVATGRGALILTGVAVMLAGIAVAARAGRLREASHVGAGSGYRGAVVMAVICGLMAPMINYAFAFGQSIAAEAVRQGASPVCAGYAVWPVALFGGLIPNLAYCFWLLGRHRTWGRFRQAWQPDLWMGGSMAVLWMGAVAIYGVSSVYLGALGTSVGWALFQIFMIMTANLSGVLAGEWKGAPAAARRALWQGLALLALATAIIASGNR